MNKIILFTRVREDYCPNCKSNRSIELYNSVGDSINYTYLLDKYYSGHSIFFDTYRITDMKCKRCNTRYMIDWTNNLPKPLDRYTYLNFINNKY